MPARTLLPSIRKSSGTRAVDFLAGASIAFQTAAQATTKRQFAETRSLHSCEYDPASSHCFCYLASFHRRSHSWRPEEVVTYGRERGAQGHDDCPIRDHGSEPVVLRLLYGIRLVDQRGHASADGTTLADGIHGPHQQSARAPDDRSVCPRHSR